MKERNGGLRRREELLRSKVIVRRWLEWGKRVSRRASDVAARPGLGRTCQALAYPSLPLIRQNSLTNLCDAEFVLRQGILSARWNWHHRITHFLAFILLLAHSLLHFLLFVTIIVRFHLVNFRLCDAQAEEGQIVDWHTKFAKIWLQSSDGSLFILENISNPYKLIFFGTQSWKWKARWSVEGDFKFLIWKAKEVRLARSLTRFTHFYKAKTWIHALLLV